jgi:hypothetical protein
MQWLASEQDTCDELDLMDFTLRIWQGRGHKPLLCVCDYGSGNSMFWCLE